MAFCNMAGTWMVQGESPAVARRRLRLALRKAREAKGFTQGQVAAALEWSLSKVQRIESGDVHVSRTDLTALLAHLGVSDPDAIDELIDVARTSRRKGWWDEPRYRQHLTPATMRLLQFESEATAIRVFDPTLIPGLLQTPAYADFIMQSWRDELSDEDRAVRFEVRMRRREHVLERANPPQYLLVLDESVLHREVAGPRVMAEQLYHLLSVVNQGSIEVRVVPFARGALLAMLNHFILLDLGDSSGELMYREAQVIDDIIELPQTVKLYRQRFDQMWDAALSHEATARLIEARAAAMLSSLDRSQM